MIQTAVDAERRSGNSEAAPENNAGSWKYNEIIEVAKYREDLQISHQTGAQLNALPFQTIELMNRFRHPSPHQNM
jgi:hypothetical protein